MFFFILFTIVVNIDTPFIPSYNLIKTNNKLAIDLPNMRKILMIFSFLGKFPFTILNYAPDYTLHPKLSHSSHFALRCYFCCYV